MEIYGNLISRSRNSGEEMKKKSINKMKKKMISATSSKHQHKQCFVLLHSITTKAKKIAKINEKRLSMFIFCVCLCYKNSKMVHWGRRNK